MEMELVGRAYGREPSRGVRKRGMWVNHGMQIYMQMFIYLKQATDQVSVSLKTKSDVSDFKK